MSVLRAALIGKDISHSISPRVHEEIFRVLAPRAGSGFSSIEYSINECDELCDFAGWLKTASTNGLRGANVTIPYKNDAYLLTKTHVGVAAATHSANTIAFNHDIRALSTDGAGLLSAILREYPEFSLERYHLVCIGAGNTSRAVLYALCTRWMPRTLTIVNRSHDRGEELAKFCIAQAPGPTVQVMSINEFIHEYNEPRYRLVIQSTPVGSATHPGNLTAGFQWNELDFAIDLTYNPISTRFLESASEAGAKTMNGLGMLIEQAAFAQYYWLTGMLPDRSPLSDSEYKDIKNKLSNELS
jgi:shikimate dehydrogenase